MCNNELGCITHAVGMYRVILDEAHELSTLTETGVHPETEIREKMPMLLGQLSPEARAMLSDHLDHLSELVAFVHRATNQVTV